ncbi:MAG: MFS transporter, partial [Burkholderiaceae bacterium]
SAVALPRLVHAVRPQTVARHDLIGFAAVVAAVVLGFVLTDRFGPLIAKAVLAPLWSVTDVAPPLQGRWTELLTLMLGIAFTLPLAAFAARKARFETLLSGLDAYFRQPQAWSFLGFIVFYKLSDAFALSLMTPFLLKGMAFAPAEVGVVNKLLGLVLTLVGALLGGALMLRLRLARALLVFGLLQMAGNVGFWWLAVHGKGALPGWVVPAFDFGFVKLAQPTPVDGGLLLAVASENLASGMGTTAFLAFLMGLTNQRFTATQFALLSAFASVGRVWVGPLAGVLAQTIGWPGFFIVAMFMALPSLVWLRVLWKPIAALDPR